MDIPCLLSSLLCDVRRVGRRTPNVPPVCKCQITFPASTAGGKKSQYTHTHTLLHTVQAYPPTPTQRCLVRSCSTPMIVCLATGPTWRAGRFSLTCGIIGWRSSHTRGESERTSARGTRRRSRFCLSCLFASRRPPGQ